jgi:radial spoke head protein 3
MSQNQSYAFSEAPRAVPGKRPKYRDHDGPAASHGKSMNNLMFDRRIVRGNTFGGMGLGGSPAPSPGSTGKKKRRKEPVSIFDLRPKLHRNKPVNLDAFLIEEAKETPEIEVQTQTDTFADLPEEEEYVPRKTGVDASTQIEPEDNLFKFDLEVLPILEVLVGKTLEQALQEVEEEDELADLRSRKQELYAAKAAEDARIRQMEVGEIALHRAKEERKASEIDRVERERVVSEKVSASSLTNQMVGDQFVDRVFDRMQETGFFKDATRIDVENKFMPWIMDMVGGELANIDTSRRLVDAAIKKALHTQRRAEDMASLKRDANNALALNAEQKRDGPKMQGVIRINVQGVADLDEIGPIALEPNDTIEQVEAKIQEWVRDYTEKTGTEVPVPDGGFLNAGVNFNGKQLGDGSLLENDIPDMATLSVGPGEAAAEAEE